MDTSESYHSYDLSYFPYFSAFEVNRIETGLFVVVDLANSRYSQYHTE